ncbi:MAG: class I SAM-dependent methyltransferase [Geobacter sp.]|nr:class I SAM-dependent methyltransferase [Geobacter sp.]
MNREIIADNCPLCGSEDLRPNFEHFDHLLKCGMCGIVFDTRNVFDQHYYEHDRARQISDAKIRARQRNVAQRVRLVDRFLNKNQTLLDIGCGEGLFLQAVRGHVEKATGLEPTQFYASYASEELKLDVRQGLIETVDFGKESFDVITLFHVLEHLDDPAAALINLRSWLRPGGLLVIEVPNIESPTARYRGPGWELIIPEHRFHFSPESMRFLLRKCGFEVVDETARDFDQYRTSVGKSLRKLFWRGRTNMRSVPHQESPHRKQEKVVTTNTSISPAKKIRKNLGLPFKALMGWLVLKGSRGDYIFVVARKTARTD